MTLDSVIIGKRFEELIEKKHKIERDVKREHSKMKTELWNEKLEEEKRT